VNREEIKGIVREVLLEMVAPFINLEQPEPKERWMDLKDAWEPLGYPSYNALYRAVQAGLLREGKEVCDRRKPGAMIARWQVDIVAARKRLLEDPSRRRGV
jgi:hypothetical protein